MIISSLDYRIFHAVDEFAGDYTWLAHATYLFETIGVVLYAAAVVVLWLATEPGKERRWKIAALSGAASAGLALLINQVIAQIWHRPRPYETHPQVYHLTKSHDPSFPSDHASAAFGIAFGIYFIDRRVGKFFLAVALLIGFGRLLVGAHYLKLLHGVRYLAARSLSPEVSASYESVFERHEHAQSLVAELLETLRRF
jgi:undecaprenyl-diphosphatase